MQPTHARTLLTDLRQNLAAGNDIGYGESAAGFQNAESLAQNFILVGGKIDDAVGDDDVDRVVGQRNVFNFAFQKFDVFNARFALVFVGESQHLVGHVESIGFAGGADAPGGEQHVDAAARAEIENGFARLQFRERRRIAAAERGQQRFFRDLASLGGVVKISGDGIAATGRSARAAAGTASCLHAQGSFAIFLLDDVFDVGGFRCS